MRAMDTSSPRDLLQVPQEWSITQVMLALESALAGRGPALTFAPSRFSSVPAEIAVVIPTSGSSGSPKEVAISAAALIASTSAAHQYLEASAGDRWSLLLPINHIAGVNVLLRVLALHSEIVDLRKSIKSRDVEFTAIVPTQLYRAMNGDEDLLQHIQRARAVLVGGASTSEALLADARAHGVNVITTYGMSEMSGGCVYNQKPLDGVSFTTDESGRVLLKGPMRASTYLGNPEAWQRATDGDWFLTSDVGSVIDGSLLVQGRIDDQIISGGEKISLNSLEDFLNSALAPQKFMTCALPDQQWGQALCLASDLEINHDHVKDVIRKEFGAHTIPKFFLGKTDLPLTSIGKPDRQTLAGKFERVN